MDNLTKEFQFKRFKKGEFLSTVGEIDRNEYFVLSGIVHSSVIKEDGTNVTTDFYMEQSIITPHFSRTLNGKSILNLETLVDTTIAQIPVKVLDSFRSSCDDIKAFGSCVVDRELNKSLHFKIAYRSLNAGNRLILFRKNYPNLENLIPHTYIASYLGITPVSFSRLRRALMKM